jgi:hypothetical protein
LLYVMLISQGSLFAVWTPPCWLWLASHTDFSSSIKISLGNI